MTYNSHIEINTDYFSVYFYKGVTFYVLGYQTLATGLFNKGLDRNNNFKDYITLSC